MRLYAAMSDQQRQAILANPQGAFQHAISLMQKGQLPQALAFCQALLTVLPDLINAWVLCSQIALQMRREDEALSFARQAFERAPEHTKAQLQLADCLIECGEMSEALSILAALETSAQSDALIAVLAGNMYVKADHYTGACESFKRAVTLKNNDVEAWHLYSGALAGLGNIDAAGEALDKVLSLDPHHYQTLLSRAQLNTKTPDNNHVDSLLELLPKIRSSEGEVLVCYALAKELEDLERYEESFQYLKRGADLNDKLLNYDVQRDVVSIQQFAEVFEREIKDLPGPDTGGEGLVFILGLPRTGSTLCDRILSAHSDVASLGETSDFHFELLAHAGRVSLGGKRSFIESLAHIDYHALGQDYLRRTKNYRKNAKVLIDKTPNNALYLGLIKKALPDARIVYSHKAPMDSCYSLYKAVFKNGYPFSYSLPKLGQYYIAFDAMMASWRKTFPQGFLELSYEAMVAEQEEQSRTLLNFCGLTWESGCLDFHRQRSATATASVIQVRQAVYKTAVKKWENYSEQLQPLQQMLRQAGLLQEQ
jgi:tetratricopeptide (TPR) repeat protein